MPFGPLAVGRSACGPNLGYNLLSGEGVRPAGRRSRRMESARSDMDADQFHESLVEIQQLLEKGQAAAALESLDALDVSEAEPEDRHEAAALRSWALTELGRAPEALALLDELLGEAPEAGRLHSARGAVLCSLGDMGEARLSLERALELDEDDELALSNLATVCHRLNDFDRALSILDRLGAMGADLDWVLPRRAAVLSDRGDAVAARSTLRRYLCLNPEDSNEWISLAILHSDEGEFEQAFDCYRRAEEITPDSAPLRLNWGVTAVRAGDVALARRQLAYLRRLDPRGARPCLLRAFILEQEGKLRAARSAFDRALRIASPADREELAYTLEMCMDFFVRQKSATDCRRLLAEAYAHNLCTVEICELCREITGQPLQNGVWYSLVVEADYRPGLEEVLGQGQNPEGPFRRYRRNVQLVASDRDEALAWTMEFLRRMGERQATVREILREEQIEDTFSGLYEIEPEALVFSGGDE